VRHSKTYNSKTRRLRHNGKTGELAGKLEGINRIDEEIKRRGLQKSEKPHVCMRGVCHPTQKYGIKNGLKVPTKKCFFSKTHHVITC
jgi:hypothetical protein